MSKIGSVLGKPVQCDVLTSSMSRLSFARILVEIDLLVDLKHSVSLALPNGAYLNQKIVYETLLRFCKHCRVIGHNIVLCPHSLDKKVPSTLVKEKVVSVDEKVVVKRWVPVKEVILNQAKPIEQQLSDVPPRPTTNEEATRPIDCEEPSRPNDVQGSSSLNESFDE